MLIVQRFRVIQFESQNNTPEVLLDIDQGNVCHSENLSHTKTGSRMAPIKLQDCRDPTQYNQVKVTLVLKRVYH